MPEFDLKPAWRRDDPAIAADVTAFWDRLRALPEGVSPRDRLSELCVAAYRDGALAGVSTVALGDLAAVRARVGYFRCLVAPHHRRSGLATDLLLRSRELVEAWARDNPEEGVMGLAAVIENVGLDIAARPVWPRSRMTLIGHTPAGLQIRLSWFDHALVGPRPQRPSGT
jgi:GNAT superfamily N-acetyltransferase